MDNSTKTQPLYFQTKIPPYLKNGSLLFLFALLAIDFVFMGLHTLKSLGYLYNPELSVTKNFGYAETFQYLKAGFIASWFFLLAWRHKRPLFYLPGAINALSSIVGRLSFPIFSWMTAWKYMNIWVLC